jgi:hypothetical protein
MSEMTTRISYGELYGVYSAQAGKGWLSRKEINKDRKDVASTCKSWMTVMTPRRLMPINMTYYFVLTDKPKNEFLIFFNYEKWL